MKRLLAMAAMLAATIVVAAPAAAHHEHRRCRVTVHQTIGSDEALRPYMPPGAPTDLGSVKVYLLCD